MRVNWGAVAFFVLLAVGVGGVLYLRWDAVAGAVGAALVLLPIGLWSSPIGGGSRRDR